MEVQEKGGKSRNVYARETGRTVSEVVLKMARSSQAVCEKGR